MRSSPALPEPICLVVAHPDDENLWFSSVLGRAERVIVCHPGAAALPKREAGRKAALAEYPLPSLRTLDLQEANVYGRAHWPDPQPTEYGLALRTDTPAAARALYRRNYDTLAAALAEALAGFGTVFTHNPWGEYGHEEHVQVFRAVAAAQAALGFTLCCSGYFGNRSAALMLRELRRYRAEAFTLPTAAALAERIAALYKKHDVWTWANDYAWPEDESFLVLTGQAEPDEAVRAYPLNYLRMAESHTRLADLSLRQIARKVRSRIGRGRDD